MGGNGISDLLDGDKNKSIPLVMGFNLKAPKAHLSQPPRPKFNLVLDTVQIVMTAKFKKKRESSSAWKPRKLLKSPPLPPHVLPVMNSETMKSQTADNDEAWKEVPRVWQNASNKPDDVVQLWAAKLRLPEKTLTGTPPARLLSRFEQMVPALPLLALGAA